MVLDRLFGRDRDSRQSDLEVELDPVVETSSLRRVLGQMDALSIAERRFITGFAYVLMRVARADLDVSQVELAAMERAVTSFGHLSEAQGVLVVELARKMNTLFGATEDYALTREFARNSTRDQCEGLLRTAFAVSDADAGISEVESVELSEIGMELGFSPEEIDSIREEFGDQLPGLT